MAKIVYNLPLITKININNCRKICRTEFSIYKNNFNVYVGYENGDIKIFKEFKAIESNFETKSTSFTLLNKNKHKSFIYQMRYRENQPQTPQLITCSDDKTVKIWCLIRNKCLITITDQSAILDCLFIENNDNYKNIIIYGTNDGSVKFFNLKTKKIFKTFEPFIEYIDMILFKKHIINERSVIFSINQIKLDNFENNKTPKNNLIFIGGNNCFTIYDLKKQREMPKNKDFKSMIFFLDNDKKKIFFSHSSHISEINCNNYQIRNIMEIKQTVLNGLFVNDWFLFNNSKNMLFIYNLINNKIIRTKKFDKNIHKIKMIQNTIFIITSL